MSVMIEDLARDRIRQIQRDTERRRHVSAGTHGRRAAKARSAAQP